MKTTCTILAAYLGLAASIIAVPAGQKMVGIPSACIEAPCAALAAKAGKLEAPLSSGGSLKGKAAYTEEVLKNGKIRQKLSFEIQGAIPGVKLEITVKGAKLGQITADSLGRAKLELKAGGDDPGALKSLPSLVAGDAATVGGASGRFAAK